MIIDSHAHLTHYRFEDFSQKNKEKEYPYLTLDQNGACIRVSGTRSGMIDQMKSFGIVGVIEPAITFFGNKRLLEYAAKHSGYIYTAVGRHPKDCFEKTGIDTDKKEKTVLWDDRHSLENWSHDSSVVAIGETGLDNFYAKTFEQKRLQRKWFRYQIELAYESGLPLILHIRQADKAALRILKRCRHKLHGGVVHCFCGNAKTAKKYLKLGLYLGIGGSLMREKIAAAGLREAVRETPLDRLIIETDAPFQAPDIEYFAENEKKKNLRNSPLLLPKVIREIAKIKGITPENVEQKVYENTVKLFRLYQEERISSL